LHHRKIIALRADSHGANKSLKTVGTAPAWAATRPCILVPPLSSAVECNHLAQASESTMEIAKIFARYTNAVSQIYLYQSAVKTNAKKELEQIVMYERSLEEIPELKGVPLSAHNMFFLSAENGKPYFFAYKESSLEDKKKAVVLHKNKQYQWLLAEVYELFEDFIKEADALAGYKDKNFWNLSDTRTEEKRKKLQPILNHFRQASPNHQN
jgi:hypothetical protein